MILNTYLKNVPLWAWITVAVAVPLLIVAISMAVPKPVTFSYGGQSCVPQLVVAPAAYRQRAETGFVVEVENVVRIGDVQLFGTGVCIAPTKSPTPGTHSIAAAPFGSWFASKQFVITVPEAPVARSADFVGKTVPTTRPLAISLNAPDETFAYSLVVEDKRADCSHDAAKLNCDIPSLDLDQGKGYTVSLDRYYNDTKVSTLATGSVQTLMPLVQVSATVANGQVVYDKPTELSFTYDKQLARAKATLVQREGETTKDIPITVSVKDTSVVIAIAEVLARKAQYTIHLESVEGKDGSSLSDPVAINFSTSGGPKVTGVSVGSSGIAQAGVITLTFDQEITNVAKLTELVTAQGAAIQVSKNGQSLRLAYSGAELCGDITLSVKKGLESSSGIVQDEDWAFNTRTLCYTVRTIGHSKQGRVINAYTYGSGAKAILYVGSIHGNEHSSRLLMNAWMSELDANPRSIPAGTRIVVIPSSNPDGTAANTRTNSSNVDLNRNFNTSDWQKDVQTVSGSPFPNGGGAAPESEQETKVLAQFTREIAPSLTMSYHSTAAYAIGNSCGNTAALAARYSELTGYRNMTGVSGAFNYQITGTYDDWICERLGRRSVLIELATQNTSEFARNRAALWEMARQ